MVFSGISIIVTILSMLMEKSLLKQQEYTLIKMDIISKHVVTKANKCRKKTDRIQREIGRICGLDPRLIEIVQPTSISNGLRMEIYLYIKNEECTKNGYFKLIKEANQSGAISQCIYESWKLLAVPDVQNLKFMQIASMDGDEELQMTNAFLSMKSLRGLQYSDSRDEEECSIKVQANEGDQNMESANEGSGVYQLEGVKVQTQPQPQIETNHVITSINLYHIESTPL